VNPVANSVEELTPAWLTYALCLGGHDLVVRSVTPERIGSGQMGTAYRLQLGYEGTPGPVTLVAKQAALDPELRSRVSTGYAAEVGFYSEIAPTLSVRIPRCWYGAISEDKGSFTLLLEDATPAMPGVQAEGCTVERAGASIMNLVGLHAPRWNDPRLRELDFLMRPSETAATIMGKILTGATKGFVERYAEALADDDIATLHQAAQVIAAWQLARLEPFAVIHGDYRLDNLMFHPSSDEVLALDWQGAALGPPLRDVAFFLGTSVEPDVRRAIEQQLLAEYHAGLLASGVRGYDADQCWIDYRLGHLQGTMVTVSGCMYASGERSQQSDAMFLAMARRSCAAIRDLRSLELL
jgi:phosphotransferase family enzyme